MLDLESELQQILKKSDSGRLRRACDIALHYRWSQMARRLWRIGMSRVRPGQRVGSTRRSGHAALRQVPASVGELAQLSIGTWGERARESGSDLKQGRLCLLSQTRSAGCPIEWKRLASDRSIPHLWRFHLQYHEFLAGYAALRGESGFQPVWRTLESWLDAYPPSGTLRAEDAWHPYCISRRVPVWCWILLATQPENGLRQRMLDSMVGQCDYLCENLEYEIGGNHLLENLAALTAGACVVDSPQSQKWLDSAEQVWSQERERQILPHGEHFELSPMYHCQVTANLFRQSILAEKLSPRFAGTCREDASRMLDFLMRILHPDGEIPLFADSGWHETPSVAEIRRLAGINNVVSSLGDETGFAETGSYWTARWMEAGKASAVIFDGGEVAAKHLPAHAHADPGTLEISIAGTRWITDSGNFGYDPGSMRDYCRSSMAHNLLTVGGQNNCDVWGGFRMGRRAGILHFESGRSGEIGWTTAKHDGYRDAGLSAITRCVAVDARGNVQVSDMPEGTANGPLSGYIHLAPGIQASRLDDSGQKWELKNGNTRRWLIFSGVEQVELAKGWYCPEFGKKIEALVMVYRRTRTAGPPLTWQLAVEETKGEFDGYPFVPVRH